MPRALPATPRKMLPPPMTSASSHPERVDLAQLGGEAGQQRLVDAVAGLARERLAAELQEDAAIAPGARRSRTGLRLRARLQPGSPSRLRLPLLRLSELEAREAPDGDVLAQPGDRLLHHVAPPCDRSA